jgi:hypothetical protein
MPPKNATEVDLSVQSPPYLLSLLWNFKPHAVPTEFEAILSSPALDERLSPNQSVLVRIEAKETPGQFSPAFTIDSFVIDSVAEFVRSQRQMCEALERALEADLREFGESEDDDDDTDAEAPSLWSRVGVNHLMVGPKDVPPPESIRTTRDRFWPELSLEEVAAKFPTDSTRSDFTLILDVRWDDEHMRAAQFRDGNLIEFSVH